MTINCLDDGTLDNFTLTNNGYATWMTGNIHTNNGAVFNNLGTFDDQVDGTFGRGGQL